MNKNNNIFVNISNAISINELVEKERQLAVSGHYKEAISLANYILSIENNNTKALHIEGLLLDDLGNHTGAIALFDKVLAINATDNDALYHKGVALGRLGNHTGAIALFDKVLAIDPDYSIL